jgi:hypothetical protein
MTTNGRAPRGQPARRPAVAPASTARRSGTRGTDARALSTRAQAHARTLHAPHRSGRAGAAAPGASSVHGSPAQQIRAADAVSNRPRASRPSFSLMRAGARRGKQGLAQSLAVIEIERPLCALDRGCPMSCGLPVHDFESWCPRPCPVSQCHRPLASSPTRQSQATPLDNRRCRSFVGAAVSWCPPLECQLPRPSGSPRAPVRGGERLRRPAKRVPQGVAAAGCWVGRPSGCPHASMTSDSACPQR